MIVEGYDLHLYCDGPHPKWHLNAALGLTCTGEFGGRNRREAWEDARRFGWSRVREKVYCPDCSARREQDKKLEALNKAIREEHSCITAGLRLGGAD